MNNKTCVQCGEEMKMQYITKNLPEPEVVYVCYNMNCGKRKKEDIPNEDN